MSRRATIVWFRNDLRLADHPALSAAAARGGPVIPLFIWSPLDAGNWPPGAAARWWLHHSLEALAADLERRGSRLILRTGAALPVLRELISQTGAGAVLWNRRYGPDGRARDADCLAALLADGVRCQDFTGSVLYEPHDVRTQQGRPFQVFTAYWRACLGQGEPAAPRPAPQQIRAPAAWPNTTTLNALRLLPRPDWAAGLRAAWTPGERGAQRQLAAFLTAALPGYAQARDYPAQPGTSRLSPHLQFGEISPRQVWHAVRRAPGGVSTGAESYLRELGWREFAHHILLHFPHTVDSPLRPQFAALGWRRDEPGLRAWRRGRTGYPIVDAGMRELWQTGWMHNRVRMIAGSLLVKHLLIDWREGAAWFWDTLVDADLANNTLGWQWVAGCGADAAPYFRIFNPILQGRKFDSDGAYVRRWVPELARLPAEWIHTPWEAPAAALRAAGVELGTNYPRPIVAHEFARQRALAALAAITAVRS